MTESTDPLFLVTAMDDGNRNYVAETVLISPSRAIDFHIPAWTAWAPGILQPIECQHFMPKAIACGIDQDGNRASWAVDDRKYLGDSPLEVLRAAANFESIVVSPNAANIPKPFFLSPNRNLHPIRQAGQISLSMLRFDQSADLQAFAAYYENWQDPYPPHPNPQKFLQAAHQMTPQVENYKRVSPIMPRAANYFPVSVRNGERTILGALRLIARKTRWWQRDVVPMFEAELFWSERIPCLEPETVLFRSVTWYKDGVQKQVQAEVARVIRITS